MASPILMQNENLSKELSKSKVGRSAFNLSHSKTFPMYIGAMYPCMCLPTMPTESVEINCTALLKQLSPLTVPLMADLKLNTAFYWVDYRLAWKKFERFMQGGRTGNETYDLPKYGYTQGETTYIPALSNNTANEGNTFHSDLRTYLGITKEASTILPEALPFFAYQMICRDFYTNVDRLTETAGSNPSYHNNDNDWCYNNLFPANPDTFRLSDGVQRSVNGVYLDKIRYHEFRPDYFLSSTYAPMRGDAPTITISNGTLQSPIQITNPKLVTPEQSPLGLPITFGSVQNNTELKLGNATPTGTTAFTVEAGSGASAGAPLYAKLSGTNTLGSTLNGTASFDYTISAQVTAAQLTWLNQLTTYKELNVLCKPYYKDFLNAHFDSVRIGEEQTERPVYIGGSSQRISISEVTQVSQSTDSSPLGTVGAKAGSLDSNNIGQFFCNDYGVIIGIAYIVPDVIYEPALPRWLTRDTNLDFYSPEFANLSMQAILNREFYVSDNVSWNNEALGYQGAFDELRSMPNQVSGDLLNDSMSDLQHYVMLRKFANNNKPELTHEFLSMRNNIDYSAWALGDSVAPFIGQFANYVNAIMPMPYVAVPKH